MTIRLRLTRQRIKTLSRARTPHRPLIIVDSGKTINVNPYGMDLPIERRAFKNKDP
jgi:hypothetical protein